MSGNPLNSDAVDSAKPVDSASPDKGGANAERVTMSVRKNREPRDPYRNVNKERRDMNASLVGGVFALALIFLELQNPLFNQKFSSNLALLLPENIGGGNGIPVEVMSGGALGLFIAAEAIKALSVAAIALLIILVVRSYTKGEFFTFRTARRVGATSWLAFIYPLGLFVQRMGENMVAHELGLDIWYDRSGNILGALLPLWFVVMMAFSMLGVMLYRAARMQQDQEGLI